jgi:hypothetical protein
MIRRNALNLINLSKKKSSGKSRLTPVNRNFAAQVILFLQGGRTTQHFIAVRVASKASDYVAMSARLIKIDLLPPSQVRWALAISASK